MRNKVLKNLFIGAALTSIIISGCGKKTDSTETSIVEESTIESLEETSGELTESDESIEESTENKKTEFAVQIPTQETEVSAETEAFVPEKSEEGRWQKNKNGTWYFILNSTNEQAKNTALEIGDKVYYFNDKGELENEGWAKKSDGTWTYVKNNKWFKGWVDGIYYTDETGMAKGFKEIDGKTYYFDDEGLLKEGWVQVDNKWFYTISGIVQEGLVEVDGINYGLSMADGMLTGMQELEGKKYYFNEDGTAGQGLVESDGKKYYCEKGEIKTGKIPVSGTIYKFDTDGTMVTGEFVNGTFINEDGTADAKKKVTNVGSLADKDGLDKVLNRLPSKLVDEYFVTNGWKLIYDTTATGSMEEIEGTGAVSFTNKFMKFHNVDTICHRFGHYIQFTKEVKAEQVEPLRSSEFTNLGLDEYFNKNATEYFAETCGEVLSGVDISKAPETEKFIREILKAYD